MATRTTLAETTKTKRVISRQTALHVRNLLSTYLDAAVERGHLAKNPLHDLSLPRTPRRPAAWTYLTPEEVRKVAEAPCLPLQARVAFLMAIYTGLRQSELWGLHWEDVDLDGARPALWVRASGDDLGWADRKLRDGVAEGHKTKAGITRHVRFHDLRHTCSSHLVMGSWGHVWRLEEVRDFLGHSSITVTQRYAHLSPEHLHASARRTARKVPRKFHARSRVPHNTAESLARPKGFEPLTVGLEGRCSSG